MKRITLHFFLISIIYTLALPATAQDLPQIPKFFRINFSAATYTVNAIPAEIDLLYADESFDFKDTIWLVNQTNNLNTYGFSTAFDIPLKKEFTLDLNTYVGWGGPQAKYVTFLYQAGVGRRINIKKFTLIPTLSLGFIQSSHNLGNSESFKGYFEIDNNIILDAVTVRLKSRAIAVVPSCSITYPLGRVVSLYGKVNSTLVLRHKSFVTFTGEQEELGAEGETIYATEKEDFADSNLSVLINGDELENPQSNYLHYNFFNSQLFQVGISINLVTLARDNVHNLHHQ